jgi:HEPN domain-containing protein
MPPKVHDLLRLAERAGLGHSSEHQTLLARLNNYYIETRYPEEVAALAGSLTRELAAACLAEVKEYISWLGRRRK